MSGESVHFDQQFMVYQGPLAMGQHFEMPFCFVLPVDVPTSFEHRWTKEGNNCYALSEFRVRAHLVNTP